MTTDGPSESQLDKRIAEFERSVGLPPVELVGESQVQKILTMAPTELARLRAEECLEYSFVLNQFCLHLQRSLNQWQGKLNWALDMLKRTIAEDLPHTPGGSLDERRSLAISRSERGRALDKFRLGCQFKVDLLQGLVFRVDSIGKTLTNIHFGKRNESHQGS